MCIILGNTIKMDISETEFDIHCNIPSKIIQQCILMCLSDFPDHRNKYYSLDGFDNTNLLSHSSEGQVPSIKESKGWFLVRLLLLAFVLSPHIDFSLGLCTHTHTHTSTQRERQKQRGRDTEGASSGLPSPSKYIISISSGPR